MKNLSILIIFFIFVSSIIAHEDNELSQLIKNFIIREIDKENRREYKLIALED